jgi:hypothetical protein
VNRRLLSPYRRDAILDRIISGTVDVLTAALDYVSALQIFVDYMLHTCPTVRMPAVCGAEPACIRSRRGHSCLHVRTDMPTIPEHCRHAAMDFHIDGATPTYLDAPEPPRRTPTGPAYHTRSNTR